MSRAWWCLRLMMLLWR